MILLAESTIICHKLFGHEMQQNSLMLFIAIKPSTRWVLAMFERLSELST